MKKFIVILAAFLILPVILLAQDNSKQIAAFAESYAKEAAGNYADAAKALKAVYAETSYEINLRLGWLTYLQGQFTESLAYYNRAIELMPYAIEPRLGVAYPASAQGNWDYVVLQYKEILKIDPNQTLTLYRMGLILYERKEYQQAAENFAKVVNLYPFDHDSLLMLAWTSFQLGKTREAKVLFQKVLLYNPNDKSAQEGLSLIAK
ncbi:MAG: tetratricopeptide repeat protein [Tenuifilaceae bacterium]|jgi:tetratricopeptide (TPR) repeat protein|nr:tetratricopeptide repeat protein [Tenuifilaceae bacterium]